jgi:hypothetical protein
LATVGVRGPSGQAPGRNWLPASPPVPAPEGLCQPAKRSGPAGPRGGRRPGGGLTPTPPQTTPPTAVQPAPTPAPGTAAGGLVTSAITRRGNGLEALWQPRFPGPELVQAAAAMYPGRPAWDGTEGPRPRITIAPGVLQLSRPDLGRRERTANRQADHRARYIDQLAIGSVNADISDIQSVSVNILHIVRGQIRSWSGRSRSRMVCRLAQLDWTPLTSSSRLPAMITLTYPGDWQQVAPDRAAVNRHLDQFRKRFDRAWGEPLLCAWKFEFQRRGAPHWHAYMVPPHGFAGGLGFRQWLSATWADIVAHPDPEQRRRHQLAGTGVDFAEGMRSSDPKRLAVYFGKHGSFRAKDRQNTPPREWAGKSCGRFWGYWGLRPATAAVELAPGDYVTVTRTLRRYARSQGVIRQVQAPRARGGRARPSRRDVAGLAGALLLDAHRVRRRTVRRRARYLHRGAGFVCVNDGPGLAAVLSRLVVAVE